MLSFRFSLPTTVRNQSQPRCISQGTDYAREAEAAGFQPLRSVTQRTPLFLRTYRAEDVLPIFGLSPEDALPSVPIQRLYVK
jgi:hypothetical protein